MNEIANALRIGGAVVFAFGLCVTLFFVWWAWIWRGWNDDED